MKKLTLITLMSLIGSLAFAETMPPTPTKYFNDLVGLTNPEQARVFNEQLAQFERDTSNQFVVYIAPYMDTDSDAFDYTNRIARSWGVGQKDKRNGLVLFIFMKTASGHGRIQAQVGYGLEGAIPDYTAKKITDDMAYYFKKKEYTNAIGLGIAGFMSAAKDEHKGKGQTVAETPMTISGAMVFSIFFIFVIIGGIISITAFIVHKNNKRREEAEREEEERQQKEWEQRERQRDKSKSRFLPIPIPISKSKKEAPTRKEESSSILPIAIAAAAIASTRRDDDDDDSNSSSGSNDSGGGGFSSDFGGGGGDFGGGGGGSDF